MAFHGNNHFLTMMTATNFYNHIFANLNFDKIQSVVGVIRIMRCFPKYIYVRRNT